MPVRVPKTAELIAQSLRAQIIQGHLRSGDMLPPEAILIEQFGVSRPTLREAFRVLEAESLIHVERGVRGGARVDVPSEETAARYMGAYLQHIGTAMMDVQGALIAIEPPAAAMLAHERTAPDLRALEAMLVEGEQAINDPEAFLDLDARFHRELVRLSGNATLYLIRNLIEHIAVAAGHAIVAVYGHEALAEQGSIRRAQRAHQQVVELIRNREEESAEALWTKHLEAGASYLDGLDAEEYLLDLY
jgi:DNA-binding FadR family transcriptional regulator